jgi:hypothetical protein
MEKLHRRRFLQMGVGAAIVGLSAAGGPLRAYAASGVTKLDAEGEITYPVDLPHDTVRVSFPTGGSSLARVQLFYVLPNGSVTFVADIPFTVERAILTASPDTVELAGTIVSPVVSPFPDLVGRAIAVSAGFTQGSPVAFHRLTVTVAGSHTVIAASATGILG